MKNRFDPVNRFSDLKEGDVFQFRGWKPGQFAIKVSDSGYSMLIASPIEHRVFNDAPIKRWLQVKQRTLS